MDASKNARADYLKGAYYWHIDGTLSRMPILVSLPSARILAPEGGDTGFCNTYAACDRLSDEDKEKFAGLRVHHSFWNSRRYHCPEPTRARLEELMALGSNELPLV